MPGVNVLSEFAINTLDMAEPLNINPYFPAFTEYNSSFNIIDCQSFSFTNSSSFNPAINILHADSKQQLTTFQIVEKGWQSTHDFLRELALDSDLTAKLNVAFGQGWNTEVSEDLVQDWLTGCYFSSLGNRE